MSDLKPADRAARARSLGNYLTESIKLMPSNQEVHLEFNDTISTAFLHTGVA
jgi:hypothetical protein